MHITFDIVNKKGMTDLFVISRFECTTTPSPPTAVSFLWSVVFDTRRCQKEIGLEKNILEKVHIFLIKVWLYLKESTLFIALYSLKFLGLNGEGGASPLILYNYINLFWYFFLFYFLSASYSLTWPCFAHFFGGKDRFSPFLNWKLLFWNCSAAVVQFVGCCTIFKIVFRPRKVIKWVLKRN